MKRVIHFIFLIFLFSSCAQKVYFFDAQKRGLSDAQISDDIIVNSYFAGDALDYVIFELDIDNKSELPLNFSYRDVYLEVFEKDNIRPIILDALDKDDIIRELEIRHEELRREKKARDIGNAVDIGINLLLIGSSGGYNTLDALLYSTDAAAFMLEDARSHKLMTGSLEEQIAYVDEWVLYKEALSPNQSKSWDVLFPRQLFDAKASFVLKIDGFSYRQDFDLHIIEEKVKR